MHERDELDLEIQQALTSYADPGHESGLEERILARIAAESAPVRRRRWLPWAIALPVAAGLLALLVLSAHRRDGPREARRVEAPLTQQAEVADGGRKTLTAPRVTQREKVKEGRGPAHTRENTAAAKVQTLPKLDVFPMPQPLSPGERALAEFAAGASEDDRQSLIEAREKTQAPIRIAAIEIKPLNAPDNGDN